jgi:hypothetical protein
MAWFLSKKSHLPGAMNVIATISRTLLVKLFTNHGDTQCTPQRFTGLKHDNKRKMLKSGNHRDMI